MDRKSHTKYLYIPYRCTILAADRRSFVNLNNPMATQRLIIIISPTTIPRQNFFILYFSRSLKFDCPHHHLHHYRKLKLSDRKSSVGCLSVRLSARTLSFLLNRSYNEIENSDLYLVIMDIPCSLPGMLFVVLRVLFFFPPMDFPNRSSCF